MMNPLVSSIWPDTASITSNNHLSIAGCDVTVLAEMYGTPLYVLDEATVRNTIRAYRQAFADTYPHNVTIHYASKALLNTALAQLVHQEQLHLDVVSGGELFVARQAGFPMHAVHFHGNAKTRVELERALAWGVGAIVVDNLDELESLAALSAVREQPQAILLRIAPGIDAHTHAHIATGDTDSKFGLPLDALDAAAVRIASTPGLHLIGLHAHIGSQITTFEPLRQNVEILLQSAAHLRDAYGFLIEEISAGGGLGVQYVVGDPAPDIQTYAATLSQMMVRGCAAHRLPTLRLTVEPGRSIIARGVVALYRVLGGKHIQPIPYIHIDGGMADNIRPALYGARYTALLANRAGTSPTTSFHIAGRYCESGDILIRDIALPTPSVSDLLAVPVSGAYTLSMASTYNLVPRPAFVLVKDEASYLIQRRENEEELLSRDFPLP